MNSRAMMYLVAAAMAGGVVSCLIGSAVNSRFLPSAKKLSAFKAPGGGYSASEMSSILKKLGNK
ncbi:MAG TPA: hypothetical protein DCZ92_03350 [Elusimicrobia bacterium]|nr:MAG: hypothetical protein A2016_02945 [Elusimicrobia bacterium GWF2_62_30]HBA59854.1 hypothetical protein [Elusimicrobiota bacterium]